MRNVQPDEILRVNVFGSDITTIRRRNELSYYGILSVLVIIGADIAVSAFRGIRFEDMKVVVYSYAVFMSLLFILQIVDRKTEVANTAETNIPKLPDGRSSFIAALCLVNVLVGLAIVASAVI